MEEEYRKADAVYGSLAGLERWEQVPHLKFVQLVSAGVDSMVRQRMWHEEESKHVVVATAAGVHMTPISQVCTPRCWRRKDQSDQSAV